MLDSNDLEALSLYDLVSLRTSEIFSHLQFEAWSWDSESELQSQTTHEK